MTDLLQTALYFAASTSEQWGWLYAFGIAGALVLVLWLMYR